jgi:S-DNA-T family DNA segregation ATPase FtsK/SpoIIIE
MYLREDDLLTSAGGLEWLNDDVRRLPGSPVGRYDWVSPTPPGRDVIPAMLARYQGLIADLQKAITARRQAEATAAQQGALFGDSQLQVFQDQIKATMAQRDVALEQVDDEHRTVRERLEQVFADQLEQVESDYRRETREIRRVRLAEREEIESRYQDSTWVTSSVLDDTSADSPKRQFERTKALLIKAREEQVSQQQGGEAAFNEFAEARGWQGGPPEEPTRIPKSREEAAQQFHEAAEAAARSLKTARTMVVPKLFIGFRIFATFVVLSALVAAPIFLLLDPMVMQVAEGRMSLHWAGIAGGIGLGAGLLLSGVIYSIGAMRFHDAMRSSKQALAEGAWVHRKWIAFANEEMTQAQKEFEVEQRKMIRQRDASLKKYDQAQRAHLAEIDAQLEGELAESQARYRVAHTGLETARDQQLAAVDHEHATRRQAMSVDFDSRLSSLESQLDAYGSTRRRKQAGTWHELKTAWDAAFRKFHGEVDQAEEESRAEYGEWDSTLASSWQPARSTPPFVRLGDYQVDLNRWPDAISSDMRLAPRKTEFRLPVMLSFPEQTSVLFKMKGLKGREQAVEGLQVLMLRLLTHLPPGKLRFTIIDPIGLGESFGGFMHLADYDEMLVTSRIWTETNHIESRLADLTEHMENVLQKYLRNEFATIEEYNEHAGEVAEPYHILVISDFPSKFSDIAARRLVSIINSGPRCGVYTLMSCDTSKDLPNNFSLADVEPQCSTFELRDGRFHSTDPSLAPFPIAIDAPPEPETFTNVVKAMGDASKDARRVEVSFQRIAPQPEAYWTSDSRKGIDIPLGRAGATKLQRLQLGRGTSQHMLIAGKTGSGKSTFLHALITNLALYYSSDEVNFYLIDFKKGVEFKQYATLNFPHARVIAIESDREFGVSTLQRLDEVLQERGDLFRKHGVQDIAGYRNANPKAVLPRILLVVDEFQEFFIEDDKLSQAAALLLDRLVRQGRAFGIHVVLGSQTLGGAYSLARSTLGQVAVRVALQCSEADAHLILSEENTAARLLTRPGEAIYNDANGLLEGNHPFQIAWLPDDERETYLRRINQLADQRGVEFEPPIVFEGNIPSDPARNLYLQRMLEQAGQEAPKSAPTIWLGEAVEIKQPTSFTFHRQSGSHLLLVGSDFEAAQGLMTTALIALAAQQPPNDADASRPTRLFVFDGSPIDSPDAANWKRVAASIPDGVRVVTPRDSEAALAELHAEMKDRDEHREEVRPPVFVFVYHLSKFRDLRKGEDDFSFGGFGGGGGTDPKPAPPSKMLSELLASGPEAGIHFVIWCDSYSNLDRWISRNTMKDLDSRIAFQMNQSDSSNFIDSPAAAKLGVHRALFYREESGTSEKFRPYGLPSDDWLEFARARLVGEDESTPVQAPAPQSAARPLDPQTEEDDLEAATDLDEFMIS